MTPRPGEIYHAHVGGDRHPVIVVSREELNRGDYVVAVPITSQKLDVRSRLRNCKPFRAGEFGFVRDCVAQAEMTAAVPKPLVDLASGPIATLDGEALRDLIRAVGYAIGADCEPAD